MPLVRVSSVQKHPRMASHRDNGREVPLGKDHAVRGRIREAISALETAMSGMWPTPAEARAKRRSREVPGSEHLPLVGWQFAPLLEAQLRGESQELRAAALASAVNQPPPSPPPPSVIGRPTRPPPPPPFPRPQAAARFVDSAARPIPQQVIDDIVREASSSASSSYTSAASGSDSGMADYRYPTMSPEQLAGLRNRLPKIPQQPDTSLYFVARSVRFYECFRLEERLNNIKSFVRVLEHRPDSMDFVAATTELLRAVSTLHYAALSWHLPKLAVMERAAVEKMSAGQRRSLVEYEHQQLVRAVEDQADRTFRHSGLTPRQVAMEEAVEEFRFNQTREDKLV